MFRTVIIPLVIVAALIALWIALGPGDPVTLNWGDSVVGPYEARTVIFGAIVALVALVTLWTLIVYLWQLPKRFRTGRSLRRRDQALGALEDALLAGAAGDPDRARKEAERARQLVGSDRLGHLVAAQALDAAGDKAAAVTHYEALLSDPKTAPTAQRGLAQQLLDAGDFPGAIEHAHLAYSQNRNARWAFDTLFRAQVAAHDWPGALKTLAEGESRKHIDAEGARRRRVVLETALADRWDEAGRAEEARELATAAAARDPEFAPGVALAARLLTRAGETRRARKLIEAAWSRRPHPALAFAYRDVLEGGPSGAVDSLMGRFSRKTVDSLIELNPGHRESTLLDVEQSLATGDYVGAWRDLAPLLKDEPSARVCLLAARCEAGLGNEQDARIWMERAATAPTEADWSDLDPSGDAFDYADKDWHRLVYSYAERGELIHPRLEANATMRLATHVPAATAVPIARAPEPVKVPEPGLPADAPVSDIAERLDQLLDAPKSES